MNILERIAQLSGGAVEQWDFDGTISTRIVVRQDGGKFKDNVSARQIGVVES